MPQVQLSSEKGSIWRKWDLHLHTPFTKLNNGYKQINEIDIWETFCSKIESSDVSVFGITDYFSCENYFTFIQRFHGLYPNSQKVFFPNVEFRLDVAVNKQFEEVNLHVIFSNKLSQLEIEAFLTTLKTNKTNTSNVRIACKNLIDNQFESATVNLNELIQSLKECFGDERLFLIIAAANNAGIRPMNNSPRKMAITDEIDKICDVFFGGRQNVEYFLRKDRYENNVNSKSKPVICGCDAHSFEDIDNYLGKYVTRETSGGNLEILKDITWIKADLTFEGLKQIMYEPQHRVIISENEPRIPVRRIESIKFKFPQKTEIQRKGSSEIQDFCLKNLTEPIYFSDNFTCIIGGRGTGKSTIVNILAQKLNEQTDFFKHSQLVLNGIPYDIENDNKNYIEIIGTNEIEFVSQGKIEKLAEANELTKLIFNERIKGIDSGFIAIEQEFTILNDKIKESIENSFLIIDIAESKKVKAKERDTIQKIIESINDERYIAITSKIKSLKSEFNSIIESEKKYKVFLGELLRLSKENQLTKINNECDTRIQEISSIITNILEFSISEGNLSYTPKTFTTDEARLKAINLELEIEAQKLRDFFTEKGTNEETIKDSQRASENFALINSDLEKLTQLDLKLRAKYAENEILIEQMGQVYEKNHALIELNLGQINDNLKIADENVHDINFTFEFDSAKFKKELFKDFYNTFKGFQISGTSESRVEEVLFLIEPNKDLLNTDYDTFLVQFNNTINENNYKKENNYVKLNLNVFAKKWNYNIYLHLVRKHLFNLTKFIKIKGYYGRRELESCSFGQRCTAVIVTLLMTGVKPLIIDEPEAHLDNKLVADYLVGLVKEKQFDRQIIFASHNSNFVINGDSSLIHILEIPNDNLYTLKTSTTIEDSANREKLLKLEGGREAFLNRECKYGI